MSISIRRLLMPLAILWLTLGNVYAQNNKDLPAKPNPPRLVNDFAHILSADEALQLERKLVTYNDSTSTQITIVIMPSIDDDIAEFGARLGDYWGIGRKQKDNGVLITVAMSSHGINIATGRGVEGAIPDVTAKKIIDDYITPNFRQQNYYQGLDQGTTAIMQALAGEFKGSQATDYSVYFILGLIILVIVFFIMFGNRGGKSGSYGSGGFWPIIFLGGGSGGGGGGSFGGGGFGGFGGGSFGGGGASGSW
ncbi:MAG: TPM domain-containing protein [Bacteroidia bacterium]